MNINTDLVLQALNNLHSFHLEIENNTITSKAGNSTDNKQVHEIALLELEKLRINNTTQSLTGRISQNNDQDSLQKIWNKLHAEFKTELAIWKAEAPQGEDRDPAAALMLSAYINKSNTLDLNNNNLSSLPKCIGNLTKLTELNLSKNRLKTIPESISNLTRLIRLSLSKNSFENLPESIGNLTELLSLNLANNKLTRLPDAIGNLTALTRLRLENNNLTRLPDTIGNLTALAQFYPENNQLTTLPATIGNLTELTHLNLSHNSLTSLPESISNLAELLELNLNHNPLTVINPDILLRFMSNRHENIEFWNLQVDRAKIKEDPQSFISLIAEKRIPDKISFIGEHAEDLGGPTKEFINELCVALLNSDAFHLTDKQLPSVRKPSDKDFFKKFGQFLSALEIKNTERSERIVTGIIFADKFFEILKRINTSGDDISKKQEVAKIVFQDDPVYEDLLIYLNNIQPSDEDNKKIKSFFENIICVEVLESPDALKEKCCKIIDPIYSASECIASGLSNKLKTNITNNVNISEYIQGKKVNSDNIINSIKCALRDTEVLKKLEWLKEKIQAATPEWLEKFLFAVTGQRTMPANLKITIHTNKDDASVMSHTCSSALDIPSLVQTKEDFLDRLELLINHQGYDTR